MTCGTVAAAGIGNYLLRLSMITTAHQVPLPIRLEQASVLVIPAALAALAATASAQAALTAGRPGARAAHAVAVAVLAVARTGSPQNALLAGMPTLWLITALLRTCPFSTTHQEPQLRHK